MTRTSRPQKMLQYAVVASLFFLAGCGSSRQPHNSILPAASDTPKDTPADTKLLLESTVFPSGFKYHVFANKDEVKNLATMFSPPKDAIAKTKLTPTGCLIAASPEFRTLDKYIPQSVAVLSDKFVSGKPLGALYIEILIHDKVDYQQLANLYQSGKCANITIKSADFPKKGDKVDLKITTKVESPLTKKSDDNTVILSQIAQGICPMAPSSDKHMKVYSQIGFASVNGYSIIFEQNSENPIDSSHFRALFSQAIHKVHN